jgi:acetolactate decarboxylase
MTKKLTFSLLIFFLSLNFIYASDTIYQAGTITALTNGQYDSDTTLKSLIAKGKYGLGTIQGAQGEMIVFNGKAYLSDISGKAVPLKDSVTIPFADFFNFSNPQINTKGKDLTAEKVLNIINHDLSGGNYFYIIKITGKFQKIHARTIPPAKKGITLSQWIAKKQKLHDLKDVEGSMIGIYSPKYLSSVAVPGFHFHFISKDKSHVYHVYGFETADVHYKIEKVNNFSIILPNTKEYQTSQITSVDQKTLSKMEESK